METGSECKDETLNDVTSWEKQFTHGLLDTFIWFYLESLKKKLSYQFYKAYTLVHISYLFDPPYLWCVYWLYILKNWVPIGCLLNHNQIFSLKIFHSLGSTWDSLQWDDDNLTKKRFPLHSILQRLRYIAINPELNNIKTYFKPQLWPDYLQMISFDSSVC